MNKEAEVYVLNAEERETMGKKKHKVFIVFKGITPQGRLSKGYKGFTFTLYEKDDITIRKVIKSKTAGRIWYEIIKQIQREQKNEGGRLI